MIYSRLWFLFGKYRWWRQRWFNASRSYEGELRDPDGDIVQFHLRAANDKQARKFALEMCQEDNSELLVIREVTQ